MKMEAGSEESIKGLEEPADSEDPAPSEVKQRQRAQASAFREAKVKEEAAAETFETLAESETARTESLASAKRKSRLNFSDEGSGFVHGAGRIAKRTVKAAATPAMLYAGQQLREAGDENDGVRAAEASGLAARKTATLAKSSKRSANRRSASKARTESVKQEHAAQVEHRKKEQIRAFHKKKRQRAAIAAKRKQSVVSAGGFVESAETSFSIPAKAKKAVQSFFSEHKGAIIGVAAVGIIFALIGVSMSSAASLVHGGGTTVISTTYVSTDEDIYAAENAYCALEDGLSSQVYGLQTSHPGYDDYEYQIDEIEHNPYHLISYLQVKFGGFTYNNEVKAEINRLFRQQYSLSLSTGSEIRTRMESVMETREVYDEATGLTVIEEYPVEQEVEYEHWTQYAVLTNHYFDMVARANMNEEEAIIYDALNKTYGNRPYLFDLSAASGVGSSGIHFDIPPEALSDVKFANMIREAEKYLGMPYVWGGKSPRTGFDCSGFVCWVLNHCGNGWNVGTKRAKELCRMCTYVSPDQARPGDLVFFEKTYDTDGASHVGIYVGQNTMLHCGNPIKYTKMTNVAGIQTTDAQKSSDMYLKCRYLDELTGGKGITFATGTPISNSMVELYTIMRYLQYDTLQRTGLGHFDSWASTFGETVTAIELAPEGTGYRAKTRFARFFNLPELISMFKEVADVQTADMLKLPVPKAEFVNEVLKPSEIQQDMVASFSDRAEAVRSGRVDPREDNMLRITNDGRKCALDQRLMNPLLPDDGESKVNACIRNAFKVWQDGKKDRTAQVIFCDLSTPKGDGSFNVYDDIRNKLEAMGVPREEIAFIHEATTETQKAELFAKVRAGQVRVLLGSTAKLGAGTNMQDRLIALHHLDAPWKPSDLEQQEGRILRQGNMNEKVQIFRYVTEGTFDAYMWQILENKQKFISQIMTSKSPVRACEDVDDTALSYAEIKALATGNPYIKEKMDLDIQVAKLRMLRASHTSQIYRLETDIARTYPVQISSVQQRIANLEADKAAAAPVLALDKEQFVMKVSGVVYTDRKDAGNALIKACTTAKTVSQELPVGEYHGFRLSVSYDTFTNSFELSVRGQGKYTIKLGADPFGNLTRINNVLEGFADSLEESKRKLATLEQQLETAKEEVAKPFPQEQELIQKEARLSELNALLNMDERGSEAALIDEEATVDEESQSRDAEEQREDAVEVDEPEQDEPIAAKTRRYQMAI